MRVPINVRIPGILSMPMMQPMAYAMNG